MATPAIPAIPEPRPKVSMLIRSGLIPIDAAMAGFWVTARTSSPSRVRLRISHSAKEEEDRQNEDRDADGTDGHHVVQRDRPGQPVRRRQRLGQRPEDQPHDLLQRDGDPEGRQKRLEAGGDRAIL